MGTSNLYKGPKETVLLPPDYNPNVGDGAIPNDNLTEVLPDSDNPPIEIEGDLNGSTLQTDLNNGANWRKTRRLITKSVGGNSTAVKSAISAYVHALGGHKNAARQANGAKRVVTLMISTFKGSISDVQFNLRKIGISFDNRSTREIFEDICAIFSPNPDTLDDALVCSAVSETVSDIISAEDFDSFSLDIFNADLLVRMTSGFIKYYIYDKLIHETAYGMLSNDKPEKDVLNAESVIKNFIDGIVDSVIKEHLYSSIEKVDLEDLVNILFVETYKVMEGLL